MTTPNFAPAGGSGGGLRTWQKVAIGCGGFVVLGVLLAGALLVGIAIGSNTAGQQVSEPAPTVQPGNEPTPVTEPSEPVPVPKDESGTAEAVVRVTGTEGLKFTGNVGTLGGSRSVEGTIPKEYEVQVKTGELDFDSVTAFFSKDFLDETEGTLRVEIVYEGQVVKQSETSAQAGSVTINWSPSEE